MKNVYEVQYTLDGRFNTIFPRNAKGARDRAKGVLAAHQDLYRVFIHRNGQPFEVVERIYNMRKNATRVNVRKV